jgi:hypothetical protein
MQAIARECKMEISMTFVDIIVEITFPYILFIRDVVNCARKKKYIYIQCVKTQCRSSTQKKQYSLHSRVEIFFY